MKNSFSFRDATFDVDSVIAIERYAYPGKYAIRVMISTRPADYLYEMFDEEAERDSVYEMLKQAVLAEE